MKLIPDWFVTSKMIKKHFNVFYADENILYFNEGSGDVIFYCNEMGIFSIDLNNIDLDNDFDGNDPDTLILILQTFGLAYYTWKTERTLKRVK